MENILFVLTYRGAHGINANMTCHNLESLIQNRNAYDDIRYTNITDALIGKSDIKLVKHMKLNEFNTYFSDAEKEKLLTAGIIEKHFNAKIILNVCKIPQEVKPKYLITGKAYRRFTNSNVSNDTYFLGKYTCTYKNFNIDSLNNRYDINEKICKKKGTILKTCVLSNKIRTFTECKLTDSPIKNLCCIDFYNKMSKPDLMDFIITDILKMPLQDFHNFSKEQFTSFLTYIDYKLSINGSELNIIKYLSD